MKCPKCGVDLAPAKRDGIDMEICAACGGMWLTRQELNELEDEVFDLGDDKKGTLAFDPDADALACPECGKAMKRFEYRFYDIEMDFCEDGHGFWLDQGEDQKVLAAMKQEEAGLKRKVLAEDKWGSLMTYWRSGSFLDRLKSLLLH